MSLNLNAVLAQKARAAQAVPVTLSSTATYINSLVDTTSSVTTDLYSVYTDFAATAALHFGSPTLARTRAYNTYLTNINKVISVKQLLDTKLVATATPTVITPKYTASIADLSSAEVNYIKTTSALQILQSEAAHTATLTPFLTNAFSLASTVVKADARGNATAITAGTNYTSKFATAFAPLSSLLVTKKQNLLNTMQTSAAQIAASNDLRDNLYSYVNTLTSYDIFSAQFTKFTGVGNGNIGKLGYTYQSGNLLESVNSQLNLRFVKGVATRGSTLFTGTVSSSPGIIDEYINGLRVVSQSGGGDTSAVIERGNWVVLNNSGGYVYITKHFKIYAIFQANSTLVNNTAVMNIIKDCYDYMSYVLRDSKPPVIPQPAEVLWDGDFKTNPLPSRGYTTNEGYVISISEETVPDAAWIAYAGPIYLRPHTQQDQYALTPSSGRSTLNLSYLNSALTTVMSNGKTQLYYVFLHEFMHALGIGTMWMNTIDVTQNTSIYDRLFVVGANDSAINAYRGLYDLTYNRDNINVYYTSNTNNNWRMINSPKGLGYFGLSGVVVPDSTNGFLNGTIPETVGQPPYAIDYNIVTSARNTSYAVRAYNEYFNRRVVNSTGNNLQLTAIPLQNDYGTVGVHWAEGAIQPANSGPGGDNRQYYGNSIPGAPCMQNELMTPVAENYDNMACSKITLGALKDLGWNVDLDAADQWYPTIHTIHTLSSTYSMYGNNVWAIDVNTTGGQPRRLSTASENAVYFTDAYVDYLRPGVEYTIINNTDAPQLQAYYWAYGLSAERIPSTWHTVPLSASDPLWYGKGAMTFTLTNTGDSLNVWIVGASGQEDLEQEWNSWRTREEWAQFTKSKFNVSPL